MLSQRSWQVRGVMWWFLAPIIAGIAAIIAAIVIDRSLVLAAWPLFAVAVACGLLAWQLYDDDGAERALTRAAAGWVLVAIAIYGLVVPALGPLFPSVALDRVLRRSGCAHPLAASAGYDEPSLVFLAGTATRLTDAFRRRRLPARRRLPLRFRRRAPGARFRAARGSDRAAL